MLTWVERIAPAICRFGIAGMALAMIGMVVCTALSFRDTRGDEGAAAMGIAIAYAMVIPVLAIVAWLACLLGSRWCRSAMQKSDTDQHQHLVQRCHQFPRLALIAWVVGLAIMCLVGR